MKANLLYAAEESHLRQDIIPQNATRITPTVTHGTFNLLTSVLVNTVVSPAQSNQNVFSKFAKAKLFPLRKSLTLGLYLDHLHVQFVC